MANEITLEQIADWKRSIKEYIITSNPNVLQNQDDTGNIVIYISNGEPFSFGDFDNETYRDLYIGDEHIAGGFGFRDIKTRNNILASVTEDLPALISDLDDRLQHIEVVFGSIGDDYQDPNLIVNPLYNTFETSFGVYELVYENGEMRVVNDLKPTISDVDIEFLHEEYIDPEITDIDKKTEDEINEEVYENSLKKQEFIRKYSLKDGVYGHNVFQPFSIKKISFIYDGTADIESFYISYRGTKEERYDTDFAGQWNNPITMDFSKKKWEAPIKTVKNEYFLTDPNKYPNEVQQLIEIEFNDDWLMLGEFPIEDEYVIRLAIIDKKNRKTVKTIAKVAISAPILFGTSEKYLEPDDAQANLSEAILSSFNQNITLNIYHGNDCPKYAWLYVPMNIFGKPVNFHPSVWYIDEIIVKTDWTYYTSKVSFPNQTLYRVYHSPNKYVQKTKWELSFDDKLEFPSIGGTGSTIVNNIFNVESGNNSGTSSGTNSGNTNNGNVNNGNVLDQLIETDLIIEITYEELKQKYDDQVLIPGTHYRIIDYITTTTKENTIVRNNHPFDVIVLALSNKEISSNAKVLRRKSDEYFANNNLEKWEIKYDINNDKSKYDWVDEVNGKGVIYYMKDEFDNEAPYDFKNIQFKRYKVDCSLYPTIAIESDFDNTYVSLTDKVSFDNYICPDSKDYEYFYTFDNNHEDSSLNVATRNNKINVCNKYASKYQQTLNNIVCIGTSAFNTFGDTCYDITLIDSYQNTFNDKCINNILYQCSYNSFDNDCSTNILSNATHNKFGKNCNINKLIGKLKIDNQNNPNSRNIFEESCRSIDIIGNNNYDNIFKNSCNKIKLNGDSNSINTFNVGCNNISIGLVNEKDLSNSSFGHCQNNTFDLNCEHIYLGHTSHDNSFGQACSNIYFANDSGYIYFTNNVRIDSGVSYIRLYANGIIKYNNEITNIFIHRGVHGGTKINHTEYSSTTQLDIVLDTLANYDYEINVSRDKNGELTFWTV